MNQLVRLLVLLFSVAGAHAAYMGLFDSTIVDEITASSETQAEAAAADAESTEFVESYIHIVDSTIITVIAWVVVVIVSCTCFFLDVYQSLRMYISQSRFRLSK